jgi:UDP-glucose:(heptosyl)LPS alpha-1,3-glucosyltransferase
VADLFVHLARTETTGTVILEALINGVPTIASGMCGFASHVTKADAGIVLQEPFLPSDLDDALRLALDPARRARWSANAVAYGADPMVYSGIDHALKAILANA